MRTEGGGIHTLSIDPTPSTTFDAHHVFASADIWITENLAGTEALGIVNQRLLVIVIPWTWHGSGQPARIVAFGLDSALPGDSTEYSSHLPARDDRHQRRSIGRRRVGVQAIGALKGLAVATPRQAAGSVVEENLAQPFSDLS